DPAPLRELEPHQNIASKVELLADPRTESEKQREQRALRHPEAPDRLPQLRQAPILLESEQLHDRIERAGQRDQTHHSDRSVRGGERCAEPKPRREISGPTMSEDHRDAAEQTGVAGDADDDGPKPAGEDIVE